MHSHRKRDRKIQRSKWCSFQRHSFCGWLSFYLHKTTPFCVLQGHEACSKFGHRNTEDIISQENTHCWQYNRPGSARSPSPVQPCPCSRRRSYFLSWLPAHTPRCPFPHTRGGNVHLWLQSNQRSNLRMYLRRSKHAGHTAARPVHPRSDNERRRSTTRRGARSTQG